MLRVSVVAGSVCSPPSSDPYWNSPDKLCALRISWFLFPKLDSYFQKRQFLPARLTQVLLMKGSLSAYCRNRPYWLTLFCYGETRSQDVMFSTDICPVVFSSLFFSTFSKKEQVLDSVCQTLKNTLPNFGQSVSLWGKLYHFGTEIFIYLSVTEFTINSVFFFYRR